MKANEAPERIWIDPANDLPNLSGHIGKDSVEYIRKDAFIEKALTFIRSCTTYDGLGYKAKCVDIENFVKYMKRE